MVQKRTRRRLAKAKPTMAGEEARKLSEQSGKLQQDIHKLEVFITGAAERDMRERLRWQDTLPPLESDEEKSETEWMSPRQRRQLREERMHVRRRLLVRILSVVGLLLIVGLLGLLVAYLIIKLV